MEEQHAVRDDEDASWRGMMQEYKLDKGECPDVTDMETSGKDEVSSKTRLQIKEMAGKQLKALLD